MRDGDRHPHSRAWVDGSSPADHSTQICVILGDPKDSPAGVFIEQQVIEKSPKSQNVLLLVQLGAPTMGSHRVQKRGAPAPPRPRGSQPGRENHGIPGVGKLVIGASEPDLSNGHLVFARVGVEFFAILTFTAVSKSGIHGY